ncbi:unnamed protein product [marine sediment metagenome]|uniref:Uncharacterized protein n=1 Tax=marine sediment metagenome TaxID=412755 RepID=X0ZWR5_9ZZZZ
MKKSSHPLQPFEIVVKNNTFDKTYNKELFKKEGYRKILRESVQSSETGLVRADLIAFDFFCITREKDQKKYYSI